MHQLNRIGRLINDLERDALHEEVLRTQGALHTRTRYDRNGRLSQKTLHYQQVAREVLPLLQKDYQYDASDNLVAEILTQTQRPGANRPATAANDDNLIGRFHNQSSTGKSYQGSAQYGYNPVEQIQSMHRSSPASLGQHIESLNYDPAGNLFDGYRVNGLIKHNRVHVYQDKRYRYDRFGRLSEKRIGSSRIQHFEYDAEHRLICIRQQQGSMAQRIVFNYDPLGRRISKQVYNNDASEPSNRTLFHWQGLRLLEEVHDGRPSLYVYADLGSYEPLARVDGKPGSEAIYYFHTNLAGLPEQLTDTDGTTVWHSEYQAWGRTRDEWHDHQPGREQNLRFQGQYLDRETGLHYNTFRFYDPDVGRFTQPDPIGLAGGLNLYHYGPNPAQWVDPLGLQRCKNLPNGQTVSEFERSLAFLPPAERVPVVRGMADQVARSRSWTRAKKVERLNNGRTVYTDGKYYYSLDTQHGRFEKIDMKKGKHLGEVDMNTSPIPNSLDPSGKHDLRVR
ncbi:RHS repeat-associated core domain-containing protein [Pseudomonas fluorescens]|uniref:RHS repeat-associated core domain-containing protein n=1 Tax=Pseudomonas fluorescens TaxID=294 RepID=UPI001FCE910F|nr:RHS repeat-associated core domain-containing protein [Pseudomonas fluorescens]